MDHHEAEDRYSELDELTSQQHIGFPIIMIGRNAGKLFISNGKDILPLRALEVLSELISHSIEHYSEDEVHSLNALDGDRVPDHIIAKSRLKKPVRHTYVYLMINNRNGLTKIGYSANPQHREKTLQSEEPEVELIWKTSGTPEYEDTLHRKFSAKRVRGEWFNLSPADIAEITK